MNYSEEQIQLLAKEVARATNDPAKVEQFIAAARAEQQKSSTKIGAVGEQQVVGELNATLDRSNQQAARQMTPGESAAYVANQLANVGTVGTMAATGQAAGAMTGPLAPIAVPLLGGLGAGAGEVINVIREGAPLSEAGGRITKSAIMGAVPIAGPTALFSREAFKQLSGAQLGELAKTLVDEGRVPTLGEQLEQVPGALLGAKIGMIGAKAKAQAVSEKALDEMVSDAQRTVTSKRMVANGYTIDPNLAKRGAESELGLGAEGGGATQLQRMASLRNQTRTNIDARDDIGLPKTRYNGSTGQFEPIPLNDLVLRDHIYKLSEPQRQIRALGNEPSAMLDNIQNLRAEKNKLWFEYRNPNNPNSLTPELKNRALEAGNLVEKAESTLEDYLAKAKLTDLLKEYRDSRRLISKTEVVKNALVGGDVDASLIAAQRDKGLRALDGKLEMIADFYDTMKQVMMHRPSIKGLGPVSFTPSSVMLPAAAATAAGFGGAGSGLGPVGTSLLAFGAGAAAPALARRAMLSPFYQRLSQAPSYGEQNPAFMANVLRFAGQSGLSP